MHYFRRYFSFLTIFLLAVVGLLLGSCSRNQTLQAIFKPAATPYEAYERSLRQANLTGTGLGADWVLAGQEALQETLLQSVPFRETGYFPAGIATAAGYRFSARTGERLEVEVSFQANQPAQLFLDLFELQPQGQPKHVASADTVSLTISYVVQQEGQYLVRLQPELLRSGRYTISVSRKPSLAFPVQHLDSRSIGSFWHSERDGGSRLHEGVDIFAKRGTPVLAAADGLITGVSVTPRGGKVVWQADSKLRQHLYYAHLDSQAVRPGQLVRTGDTLGFVGNTGNAIHTPPHLHFGIYRSRGAVDPLPFLQRPGAEPAAPAVASLKNLGEWNRVKNSQINLRQGPETKAAVVARLPKHTPVQVLAASGSWYRVALPDGTRGYVSETLLEPLKQPLRYLPGKAAVAVLEKPLTTSLVVDSLRTASRTPVLATYGSYALVELQNQRLGWVLL